MGRIALMRMPLREFVRTALKEPLVHFLLAGLALFAFFALRGEPVDPESRTIIINEKQVERLAANWAQTWQRPPTQAEIDGLIREFIKEEIYYREGMRLGLDQDDLIVRRRIGSKMEFLATSELENQRPDDATLQAILNRNPERYATETRYSFDQIYIAVQDEATARAKAAQWLAALGRGTDWQKLGDAISLPRSAENADRDRLISDFGEDFSAALAKLEVGKWTGPVASGFGWHVVRVRKVQASEKPKLADVRQAVENDWRSQTGRARQAKAYQLLLDSYTIKIAKP
jgi:peptidyl-prolyl cis-trans isomerase C